MKSKLAGAIVCAAALFTNPAFAKDAETKATAPAEGTQQNRMKACNAEAAEKSLKGDERKAFMSTCLKGQKAK